VVISFPAVAGHPSFFIDHNGVIEQLKGETYINVLFKGTSQLSGSLLDSIDNDVSLKLRSMGIDTGEFLEGKPTIMIEVQVSGDLKYSGAASVDLYVKSYLDKSYLSGYSCIWESGGVFQYARTGDLRSLIKDFMDEFLIVYLEANPRRFQEDQ
jgi:hypothetical protein